MTNEPYENPDQESDPAFQDAMERFIREGVTMPSFGRVTGERQQLLPVNMYETGVDLVVVAPVPGVRSEDIEVTVTERMLTIRSQQRGPGQEHKRYHRHEWNYGPYYRTISLPMGVDAEKANASFSNGLLVISLPKAEVTRTKQITLRHVGQNQGEYAGHGAPEFNPGGYHHPKEPGVD